MLVKCLLVALLVTTVSTQTCRRTENVLSCGHATFEDLPKERNENTTTLYCYKSNIPTLTKEYFKYIPNLKTVLMNGNKIEQIEADAFNGLNNLEWVEISDNLITHLDPNLFETNPEMWLLKANGNKGLVIPENKPFLNGPKIRWLELQHCGIKTLYENTFSELLKLRQLDLSHNELTAVPENIFKNLTNIVYLKLNDNKFSYIPPETFSGMRWFGMFLHGNPWNVTDEWIRSIKWKYDF